MDLSVKPMDELALRLSEYKKLKILLEQVPREKALKGAMISKYSAAFVSGSLNQRVFASAIARGQFQKATDSIDKELFSVNQTIDFLQQEVDRRNTPATIVEQASEPPKKWWEVWK